MKSVNMIFIFLFCFLAVPITWAINTDYYVDAVNGNDTTGSGTLASPYRTITKACSVITPQNQLPAGGVTVWLRAGTYRETITPLISGTETKPIRFAAYPGEYPTVSGADVFSGTWSVYSGNIYRASTALSFRQLFVSGQMMNEARWPNATADDLTNAPRRTCAAGTSSTTLYDSGLPAGSWNGAICLITPNDEWVSYTKTVTSYVAGSRFTFGDSSWADGAPKSGNHYVLFGCLAALDIATEWYLDTAGDYLYLWCPGNANPSTVTVEYKARDYVADLTGLSYIQFKGIRFTGGGMDMNPSASYCLIDGCSFYCTEHFRDTNGYGDSADSWKNVMGWQSSYNTWRNCSIINSAGNGLVDAGYANKVINCLMYNIGYMGSETGAINNVGDGSSYGVYGEYTYNTIFNCGRHGMRFTTGSAFNCSHNEVYAVCKVTYDGGCVYTADTYGNGAVIAYNSLHDNPATLGMGVYLDYNSSAYNVHHNYIYNIANSGILMFTPSTNNAIYNNTMMSGSIYSIYSAYAAGEPQNQTGTIVRNNLCKNSIVLFTTNPPTSSNNGNYTVDSLGWPAAGSGAIDAGYVIAGITDNYSGAAPDIGCYESGSSGWWAGVTGKRDIVGWWMFDEGSGSSARDDSARGNAGTISGATWQNGQVGKALEFNGGTDNVTVNASALADLYNQTSIAFWTYGDTTQPRNNLCLSAGDSAGAVIDCYVPWSDAYIYWDAGNDAGGTVDRIYKAATSSTQYKGQWNHWGFVKSYAGEMAIYYNGSLWQSGTGKTKTMEGINSFKIGCFYNGSYSYDGKIDDVRVYKRALTANDMADVYREGVLDGDLIGWWKFEEGSGTSVYDCSGLNHPGTITGAGATWIESPTGKAIWFSGSDYMSVSSAAISGLSTQVSISFWQYGDANQPRNNLFLGAANANGHLLGIYMPWSDGYVYWDAGNDAGGFDRISKAANAREYEGRWNHWVFTKNTATGYMKIYLNGSLWHSVAGMTKGMGSATSFKIGSMEDGNYKYAGKVDDVRVYRRALNIYEINAIFRQGI